MRCPKCSNNVYSHHQKINKSGTEIKRNYACRKWIESLPLHELITDVRTSEEGQKYIREINTPFNERSDLYV